MYKDCAGPHVVNQPDYGRDLYYIGYNNHNYAAAAATTTQK